MCFSQSTRRWGKDGAEGVGSWLAMGDATAHLLPACFGGKDSEKAAWGRVFPSCPNPAGMIPAEKRIWDHQGAQISPPGEGDEHCRVTSSTPREGPDTERVRRASTPPPETPPLPQNKPRGAGNRSSHTSPGAGQRPTVLAGPRPGHLDALLALAGGRPQLAAVAVGEPVGAAHLARGLPLAAGAHALAPHARAAEGADRAAAGFCGDRGEESHFKSLPGEVGLPRAPLRDLERGRALQPPQRRAGRVRWGLQGFKFMKELAQAAREEGGNRQAERN